MLALSEPQINDALVDMPGWQLGATPMGVPCIGKTYSLTTYMNGLHFVEQVAKHAELNNHHPEITLSYQQVTVRYWTHTASGVTLLDITCAKEIDETAALYGSLMAVISSG